MPSWSVGKLCAAFALPLGFQPATAAEEFIHSQAASVQKTTLVSFGWAILQQTGCRVKYNCSDGCVLLHVLSSVSLGSDA